MVVLKTSHVNYTKGFLPVRLSLCPELLALAYVSVVKGLIQKGTSDTIRSRCKGVMIRLLHGPDAVHTQKVEEEGQRGQGAEDKKKGS